MEREELARKIFNIVFGVWCAFDIIMRTAFETNINAFAAFVFKVDYIDVDRIIDLFVLVVLLAIIVFLQRYSFHELIILVIITIPFVIATLKADNNYLISLLLFVVAAKYADIDQIVEMYFFLLLIIIPLIIFMCIIGILPDYTMYRGGTIRHALGFEHPNRLGMRIFQLMLCFSYKYRNSRYRLFRFLILLMAALFVYIVPNSQTAFVGLAILMIMIFVGGIYDKYSLNKKILINAMVITSVFINAITVIASFFDPQKNDTFNRIDRFLSRRFLYGHRMYDYYGISIWGQKVNTLVQDRKFVGVYRQWYLDNAYLSILLRFGLIAYLIFSILWIMAIIYFAKNDNYAMVVILFAYSVYGIMTTGFYMMSHNVFLLSMSYPIYAKTMTHYLYQNNRRVRFVWGRMIETRN